MGHRIKRPFAAVFVLLLAAVAVPVALSAAGPASGDPLARVVLQVQGMTCGGCEAPLELAVKKLPGVESVKASFADGRAEVTFRPSRVTVRQIQQAIEHLGYRAALVPEAKPAALPAQPALQVSPGLRNLDGLKDLANIMRQTRGQPRLVLLLSPT